MMSGVTKALYGITLGAYLGAFAWVAARAPATVASHFRTGGEADGWMSRGQFLTAYAVPAVLFLVVFPLLGRLAAHLPPEYVNIRNKDYWLAPENRPAFGARFREDLTVIGCLTTWLLLFAMLSSVQATISGDTLPGWVTLVFVGYGLLLLGYVAWMATVRYRVPTTAAP